MSKNDLEISSTLFNEVSSAYSLFNSWKLLNKENQDSHGLSGETIAKFEENLTDKIESIRKKLGENKFKFSKTRAVLIPKDNGKYRPLQVPEIEDRVVLKSTAVVLENALSFLLKKGEGVSFAYQSGKGIKDVVHKIWEYYQNGYVYILEADIVDFFGRVPKGDLLEKYIFPNLRDKTINNLVQSALSQEIGGLEKIDSDKIHYFKNIEKGIPQGSPLSPLLSNIYLSTFDETMKNEGLKLIRYADDFIVMCKTVSDAKEAYSIAKKKLEEDLKLELHPLGQGANSKTKILDPTKDEFSFLSIQFDGKKFFPSRKAVENFKKSLFDKMNSSPNVLTLLNKISNSLDGWLSGYSFIDVDRYFSEIDNHVNLSVYIGLKKYDWRFSVKVRGKQNLRYLKDASQQNCLSEKQRETSGIPLCKEIIDKRRKVKPSNK